MEKFSLTRFYIFVLLLLVSSAVPVSAQLSAGPDDTITAGVPVRLTAVYGDYSTPVTISDDGVEGPFPIGFTFTFFGQQYNQFYIGANGWISFLANPNALGTRAAFSLPSADPKHPRAAIFGPFQDMQPEGGEFIFYHTIGDTLSRRLVVMWCQNPMYSEFCDDSLVTFQIILHEGSNIIENMIMHKPSCPDWLSNIATLGVQNETGTIGYAVPGRNATSWNASREGWRYIPATVDSFEITPVAYDLEPIVPQGKIMYNWYAFNDYLSSQAEVTVTPMETTEYRVVATLCQGEEFSDTVLVFVIPYVPNAFTPNNDGHNDIFRVTGLPEENVIRFSFQIYDRWGKLIFSTNDVREGWDGKCNGNDCPPGTYGWIIAYDEEKSKVTNKGIIILLR